VPHAYLQQLVTPSVAAAQERYGSRTVQARHVERADVPDRLGPDEAEFIAAQDYFVLASVGETGWPYVQHRGGPAGFLRVLDDGATLAWADFRGNRQYVSVGNVAANPKVSLLLLDQARQARLKVLGEARVLDDPPDALRQAVELPGYAARVERVVTVAVAGFDWNCPQHITPRWSAGDLAPLLEELQRLRAQVAAG
jgi:predicted pyridoxine 5'-phosphate oxidase superfamily flavin-nucleotide-binding protein